MTFYSYDTSGNPQWYLAAGSMTNDQRNLSGTLDKYRDGQCLTCAYAGFPAQTGNDGSVSVVFLSEIFATVTLPGGRTTSIRPFNFGYGGPPSAMLGEWVFIYDIENITFARRYLFTQVYSSGASIIALDPVKSAGCEFQSPSLVVCIELGRNGLVFQTYTFRFGLDETFDGMRSTPDGSSFSMKGFRISSSKGYSRETGLEEADDPLPEAKSHAERGSASLTKTSLEIRALTEQVAGRLREALEIR